MASTATASSTSATTAAGPTEHHHGVVGSALNLAKDAVKAAPAVVKGGVDLASQGVEAAAHVTRRGVEAGTHFVSSGVHHTGEHFSTQYTADGHKHHASAAEKLSHLAEKTVDTTGNLVGKYGVGAGEKMAHGSVKAAEMSANHTVRTAKYGIGAADFAHRGVHKIKGDGGDEHQSVFGAHPPVAEPAATSASATAATSHSAATASATHTTREAGVDKMA